MKRKKVSVAALSLLMLFSFPVLSWAKPQNTEGKWYNHAGKWYFGKDEKELLKGWIVSRYGKRCLAVRMVGLAG